MRLACDENSARYACIALVVDERCEAVRMLVAQAIVEALTLVTHDETLKKYAVAFLVV
jgi:PIN domain nuclease of toxin-antitoxin system